MINQHNRDQKALKGIMYMIFSMTIVPLMDGIAKFLSTKYPIIEIVWARYFFHLLFLFPIVLYQYRHLALVSKQPFLQIIRGGLLLSSTIFFFAAISEVPLVDALALVFISPILVTILSPKLLGEKVGFRRWLAVSVGFIGALIIIKPGLNELSSGTMYALFAGLIYSLYIVTTRKLSGSAPPLITLTYTALLGAIIMSIWVPFVWITPSGFDLTLMATMGSFAALGHLFLIKAFEHASASLLAPFGYSEIIMATLVGFIFFNDFPTKTTWIGVGIIIITGIYISVRENKREISISSSSKKPPIKEFKQRKNLVNR